MLTSKRINKIMGIKTITRTKDGVPVTECTEFWFASPMNKPQSTCIITVEYKAGLHAVFSEGFLIDGSDDEAYIPISECYSTIEALKEAENEAKTKNAIS